MPKRSFIKKNKFCKKFFLFIFSIIFSLLVLLVLFLFAEKYFFDKLFFQKSIKHGYWVEFKNKKLDFNSFNNRSIYFAYLNNWANQENSQKLEKKLNTVKNNYKIVIFGDSYLWGQGVLWRQTFSQILERRLQKEFNIQVIPLGNCGDFIGDYWSGWQKAVKRYQPDFYIFALTFNDMTPMELSYWEVENQPLIEFCENQFPNEETLVKQPFVNYVYANNQKVNDPFNLNNSINNCFVNKALTDLPRENAFYFLNDGYFSSFEEIMNYYKNILLSKDKKVVDTREALTLEDYKKYKKELELHGSRALHVSESEFHPSKLAHQFYADILYNELIKIIPNEYRK